jgi:hypothetical protein
VPELLRQIAEAIHNIPALRIESAALTGDVEHPAEPVVLWLKEPIGVIKRERPSGGHDRRESRQVNECARGYPSAIYRSLKTGAERRSSPSSTACPL